jgi:streptogramin lyase
MPHEIAIASDGNVILSDRQNHRISVFAKEGALVKRFGEYGEGKDAKIGQFSEPHGIAVNSKGDLFICDRYNFRIEQLTGAGEPITGWLTSGVFDDSKQFPIGIAVGPDGSVFVTDHYAHCIQKYKR